MSESADEIISAFEQLRDSPFPSYEEIEREKYVLWIRARTRILYDYCFFKMGGVHKPTEETLQKYHKAKEQLARKRKKTAVAKLLGYTNFRALNKMMKSVELYQLYVTVTGPLTSSTCSEPDSNQACSHPKTDEVDPNPGDNSYLASVERSWQMVFQQTANMFGHAPE